MKYLSISAILILGFLATSNQVHAGPAYEEVATFPTGLYPHNNGLVSDGAGFLWGTTKGTGSGGNFGTVFKVSENGFNTAAPTTIATFTNTAGLVKGSAPFSELLNDGLGFMWGTTSEGGAGGYGTIFKINISDSSFTTVTEFNNNSAPLGRQPYGGLVSDGLGNLWGTTRLGGASDVGTIFKVTNPGGVLTTVTEFTGNSGSFLGSAPMGRMVYQNGKVWGTTSGGGTSSKGTVFSYNSNTSKFLSVASFTGIGGALPGESPEGALVLNDTGSYLYGTTRLGGSGVLNNGTIFKVSTAYFVDEFTTAHDFFASGVTGTDWDGILTSGNLVSGNISGGILTWQNAADTNWDVGVGDSPLLYVPVTGDFTVYLHILSAVDGGYPSGGLIVYDPSFPPPTANWLYLDSHFNDFNVLFNAVLGGGFDGTTGNRAVTPKGAYMKIVRVGNTFTGYTKVNEGDAWREVGDPNPLLVPSQHPNILRNDIPATVYVGLTCMSFDGPSTTATYESFSVLPEPADAQISSVLSFNGNGANPIGGLISDGAGNFIGTTNQGGTSGFGTIFSVTTGGTLTTLYNFTGSSGAVRGRNPGYGSMLKHTDRNYYGVATDTTGAPTGDGKVFRLRVGPSPVTTAATFVSAVRGTLNGTVNPNSYGSTDYYFEWGTSPTLAGASVTSTVNMADGSSAVAVSAALTSLTEFTTYYYRLVALNVGNAVTQKGEIFSFLATGASIDSITPPANGTYRATQNIDFSVVFSAPVTVTGNPRISVNVGGSALFATYNSGTTTNTLVFRYTVGAPDTDTNGIATTSPIGLNSGTINTAGGTASSLIFTPPNTTGILVDTTSPTAAISYSPTGPVRAGASLTITATFSEPLLDSPVVRLAISGSNTLSATNMVKSTTTVYTYNHTVGAGDGAATVAMSVGTDAGGNVVTSAPTSGATFTVDNIAPTVTINQAGGQSDPSNTSPINFTVVFSESVANFTTGDVTLSGGAGATTAVVTGSGTNYNVAVSGMTGNGTVIASLAASVATDAAGNNNLASSSTDNTVTRDTVAPTLSPVTIASNNANTARAKVGDVITLSFTSNEAIQTPTVSLAGSAAVVANGGGNNWTATLTVGAGTTEGVAAISVAFSDTAGNTGTTVTSTTNASSVTVDRTAPTVTINQAGGQNDPSNESAIDFTVVFSESVTNFVTGDVTIGGTSGATTATVTGSGTTYNVAFTGMTGSGSVIASLAAGIASDATGNLSAIGTSTDNTVTYDVTLPTLSPVTIASNNANTAQARVGDVITLSFVSSEAIQTPTVTLAGSAAVVANGGGNNWTATLTVGAGTTQGAAAISVVFSDTAGNAGTTVTATTNASSVNVDRTAPTVTINQAGGQSDPSNTSPINFTVVFSESVANFVTGDVSLSGTASPTLGTVTGSGTTYNVAVTGMGATGTVITSLAAGVASDAAGNLSAVSTSTDNTVTRDTTVPTLSPVTIASNNANTAQAKVADVITLSFTSSEAIQTPTVTLAGSAAVVANGGGNTWTATLTVGAGTTQGAAAISVVFSDTAGNAGTTVTATTNASSVNVDRTAPTVTINQAGGQSDPTNATTINFTVIFSESVTNFVTGDVSLSGTASPTLGTVTGSGTTYNVAVTGMGATGTVIASLAAGVASDAAGNLSAIGTSTDNTVTRDTTVPTLSPVTIASNNANTAQAKLADVITLSFTSSEAIQTPTVTLAGSAAVVANGGGNTWTATLTVGAGTTQGAAAISVVFSDTAGNAGTTVTATTNASSVNVDRTAPTVTINQAGGQSDPSNTSPIDFTVVFSESVANFVTGDVSLSGTAVPTLGTVTGSGTTYNVAVTGMGATGTVIASLAAGVASDAAGNLSAVSTSTDNTVTRDTTAPTLSPVTIASNNANTAQAKVGDVITLSFTSNEAIQTPTVTLAGSAAVVANGGGNNWTATLTVGAGTTQGAAAISVVFSDTAGNAGTTVAATTNASSVNVDRTAPTVTINQAGGQSDPSNTSPINFTVVFSESVANFSTGDVSLSGTAGATTATVFGSGTTYNVAVSGMTGDGTVIASLAAGVASDAAGNLNAISTSTDNTVTRDGAVPTLSPVTIASNNANTARAKVGDVITLSFTSSEAIQTPTVTLAGSAAVVANGGGNTWTATLTVGGGTPEGAASIAVVFSDTAGNAGTTVTATTNASSVTVDRTAPTVTINQAGGQLDPINAGPINFTVVFSESVANFVTGDVTIGGTSGATTATVTGSGTTYNVAVTGMTGSGSVITSLAAAVATDSTGNNTQASTSSDNTVTYDVTIPTIVDVDGPPAGTYNTGADLLFTATFTEPVNVTGAPFIDVVIGGVPVTAAYDSGTGTTEIVFAYTIQATDPDTSSITTGTSISLNGGTIRDFATNNATLTFSAPTIVGVTVDTSLVAVTINQAVGQDDPSNNTTINFTVVFSETVANFATGDVTLGGTSGATTATVTGSGTTYNVAVTGMTGTGTVIASIAAGVASDGGGNNNLASTSTDNTVTYDVTIATITGVTGPGAGSYGPGNDLVFTATFTEPVTVTGNPSIGFTIGGVPVQATYVSGNGTANVVFEYTIQPGDPNSSTLVSGSSIALNGGTITDIAGNNVTLTFSAPTISGVTVDTTAVTVTINQKAGQLDPVNSSPIEFTVMFSESVADFATGDVTLGGTSGATTATVTGSGTTYNVAVTGMTGSGTVIASLAAGVANDAAGNDNLVSTSTDNSVTYDVTTATIVGVTGPGAGSYGPGDDLVFTATFTEPVIVVGTPSIDLTVGGVPVTATYVSGSGTTALVFEYTIQPGDTGAIISDSDITLNGGTIQDQAGNNVALTFTPPNVGGVTVDTTAVTVTINQAVGQDDPTNAGPINFTVVFSESVANFVTGDVTLGGTSGATTATVTGSGTTYNVAVTGMTGSGTVIASLAAGVASDAAANDNLASTSSDNTVTYDVTTATIVSVTGPAAGSYGPGDDLVFTATFTEPVTVVGTPSIDLTVGGVPVTATYVSGSGTTELVFEYTIQPGDTGVITTGSDIDLNGGTVQDEAGNNVTLTFTPPTVTGITVDTTAVTVTINQAVGQADPINMGPINFTVVFSETVANFTTGDVTLSGTSGATTATVTGSGTTYNVAVTGMTGSGTVIASLLAGVASDAAANGNEASTSTDNTVTYDITTATIVGVTGPAAGNYNAGDDLVFTATFTEPVIVVGTPSIDITIGGVPVTATYVSGSGTTALLFEYTIQPGDPDTGSITTDNEILLNGGTIRDVAGNNVALTFTPPTISGVTVDTSVVTVTVNKAVGQVDPTNSSPINFTVVFSEAVANFATGDVTLGGTAGAATAIVTGSGTTYNVAVSGMTGTGTVTASLAAGVASDASANDNLVSTSTDNSVSYDVTTATIVGVTGPPAGSYGPGDDLVFTATFTEPVTVVGTPTIELIIGGVPVTATYVSGSGTTELVFEYTIQLGDGGVISTGSDIALNGGTIQDGAGNNVALTFTPPTVTGVTVDTTAVTVTINQAVGQGDPTNAGPINFTVVFSESVADFATGDVTLGGTAGATTGTVTGSGTTYNVAVTGMTGSGTVLASLAAGVANDTAGNDNAASSSTDNTVTYDVTIATIVQVTGPAAGSYNAGDGLVFTATFTEPVFVVGTPSIDITIGGVPVVATYVSGSGTTELVFVYIVQSGDPDTGSIVTDTDIALNGGTIRDNAGNNVSLTFTPPTITGVTVDTTATSVTINQAVGQADPTNGSSINFTVVFTETVANFATGDVSLSGTAGAMTATVTGSGTTYNVAVTGMTSSGTVIASLSAGVATDGADNSTLASTSTDNTVTYDVTTATIVGVTGPPAGSYGPGDDLVFTATFTEPVFVVGTPTIDLIIGGVSVTATYVSGSGTTELVFEYTIQPGDGGVISTGSDIALNGGTIQDGAGNNVALTFTPPSVGGVTVDTTAVTVTINQAAGQDDPTNDSAINFTVVFSETVANFATGDVTLSGTAGATTVTVTGSGTTYNVAVTGMTGSGTVIASLLAGVATDAAANDNAASTSTDNTVAYDVTTATIVGVTGPPAGSYNTGEGLVFTATFTEPVTVTGSPTIDLVIGGVPVTATYVSGSGTTELVFVYIIQPGDPDSSVITTGSSISLNGGTIQDGAGNNVNTAFTPPTISGVSVDRTPPSVTVNKAVGQADPTNFSPINFAVTFSEPVSDFVAADVTLSGTAGATTAFVSGSGDTYNIAVTGMTGTGTVIASLAAGVATDGAANASLASTSTDNSVIYDITAPTILNVIPVANGSYQQGTSLTFNVNFSEVVNVVGSPYIALTIGSTPHSANYVSGSGTSSLVFSYTIQAGDSDNDGIASAAVITLNGGSIRDAALNNGVLSFTPLTTNAVLVDTATPSVSAVSISTGNPSVTLAKSGDTITVALTASEAIQPPIVTIAGASATVANTGGNSWTGTILVGASTPEGVASISISYSDIAGNSGVSLNATTDASSVSVDRTAPVLTLPSNQTIEATTPTGAVATYSPSATDANGVISTSASPVSGSVFVIGTTTVNVASTDTAGNVANGSFTVSVEDATPPVLVVEDLLVEATGPDGAIATFSPVATDSVSSVNVVCTPASGTLFPFGATTVNVTATDGAGQVTNDSFTVTVQDTTAPVIDLPDTVVVLVLTPQSATAVYTPTATDVVSTPVVVVDPPSGTLFQFGTTTVNVTATDSYGNESTGSFIVSVQTYVAGQYNGLVSPTGSSTTPGDHVGSVLMKMSKKGTFTGKVIMGGSYKAVAMKGQIDRDGKISFGKTLAPQISIIRKNQPVLTMSLELDLVASTEARRLKGVLKNTSLVNIAIVRADRWNYTAKFPPVAPLVNVPTTLLNPATDKGKYTALVQPRSPVDTGLAASAFPQGDGYAKISVLKSGKVKVIGKLADGTPFSCVRPLSKENEFPLFTALYGKKGSISAMLSFRDVADVSDADAVGLRWFRPVKLISKTYPQGWGVNGILVDLYASKYVRPPLGQSAFLLPGQASPNLLINGKLQLSDGLLTIPESNDVSISDKSLVTILGPTPTLVGSTNIKCKVNPTTGSITGSFLNVVSGKPTKFQGVIFQKQKVGSGYFIGTPALGVVGTGEGGLMTLEPIVGP